MQIGRDGRERWDWICLLYTSVGAGIGSSDDSSSSNGGHSELSMGSRGSQVSELQQQLYELGYLNAAPDGVFGTMTHSAVMVFQRENGLVVDGIFGVASWAKLYSDDVVAAGGSGIGEDDTTTDDTEAEETTPPADDPADEEEGASNGGAQSIDVYKRQDVAKLRRYGSERGKILPRRINGNCAKHQRMLTVAVKRARHLALMPYTVD